MIKYGYFTSIPLMVHLQNVTLHYHKYLKNNNINRFMVRSMLMGLFYSSVEENMDFSQRAFSAT